MTIEVNGVLYEPIPKEPRKKTSLPAFMLAAMALGAYVYPKTRSLPAGVDVVKEYGLIQLKQSRLSKADRDHVEYIFNREFREVRL